METNARAIKRRNPNWVAWKEVDWYTKRSGKRVHRAQESGKIIKTPYFYVKVLDVLNGGAYGISIPLYPFLKTGWETYGSDHLPVVANLKVD